MEKHNSYSLLQLQEKKWLARGANYIWYLSSYVICSSMISSFNMETSYIWLTYQWSNNSSYISWNYIDVSTYVPNPNFLA